MKLQFYPTDITYKIINDKAVIFIYGRSTTGEQLCVMDDGFEPYFYVLPEKGSNVDHTSSLLNKLSIINKGNIARITKTETVDKKILGKDVVAIKAYANIPKAIPLLKKEISKMSGVREVLEADIPFVRRYLIDKNIIPFVLTEAEGNFVNYHSKVPVLKASKITQNSSEFLSKPRMLAFDIETYNPTQTIDMENNPIIMLSFYGENIKKVITWKRFKTNNDFIEFVESEQKLLERFKEILEEYRPDIIAGYFSDSFDLPYIKRRAEKNRVKLDIGLDFSSIKLKPNSDVVQIDGIISLDIFKFIQRVISRKMKTEILSLDEVSSELLGKKKIKVDMEKLADVWDKGGEALERYCNYNLNDSMLAYEICELLIPNILEMVKIVGLPLSDVIMMGFSQLVEWYILRQIPNFNEIAPNKPTGEEIAKRMTQTYKGAFVYNPTPGLFKNVAVLDFRSLYPSIITAHNISPSTLNCDCCKDNPSYSPIEDEKYWFCTKRKGFIPLLIEDLINRRARVKEIIRQTADEKKKMILDARQESLKLSANAFYGYLGFYMARWYSIESARATTAYGRYYIHKVIDMAKRDGYQVIYGDTDSVFLATNGKSKNDAKLFADKINIDLPKSMELEFEGFYPVALFVSVKEKEIGAKKKYALLSEDGFIKIKGFETVRRNWSEVAKRTQEDVLNIILKENDIQKALKRIRSIVNDLKNKKIPMEQVVIHTQLTKHLGEYESIGPHVAVAQKMKMNGKNVGAGSLIRYVIVEGSGRIRDRAKMVEEVKEGQYDANYYINHQIIPAVESIFAVFGYNKENLLTNVSQATLDGFSQT